MTGWLDREGSTRSPPGPEEEAQSCVTARRGFSARRAREQRGGTRAGGQGRGAMSGGGTDAEP